MVAQHELSQLFFSSKAHIPRWTASNSTGFKSPYSPDATSMTKMCEGGEKMQLFVVTTVKYCKYENLIQMDVP